MNEQRNFILAIALSIAVLLGWQYFIGIPRMEREEARRAATETQQAESRMPAADAETAPVGTAPIPAPAPIRFPALRRRS
jgi:YidC/Oxa1 family membrane protein insertase